MKADKNACGTYRGFADRILNRAAEAITDAAQAVRDGEITKASDLIAEARRRLLSAEDKLREAAR